MDRGRSLTSTIPSVGSGTYSPGPNMARSPDEEGSNEECRCHHGPGLPRPQKPCYSVYKTSNFHAVFSDHTVCIQKHHCSQPGCGWHSTPTVTSLFGTNIHPDLA